MSFVMTFVAAASAPALNADHISQALEKHGVKAGAQNWLADGEALDIQVADAPDIEQVRGLRDDFEAARIDVFANPAENRRKKLVLADMDSTTITEETLDELAAHVGIKDAIAAITKRAMAGELDFEAAVDERVGMLSGVTQEQLRETLDDIILSDGAESLIATMKENGAFAVLVSGGFQYFTQAIMEQVGFDAHHGNVLHYNDDGSLTGTVEKPVQDKHSKLKYLKHYAAENGIDLADTLALGDGANDVPMLLGAGMGIGYHPKKIVADQLMNVIIHGGLTAALYAQGYKKIEFVARVSKAAISKTTPALSL